MAESRGPNAESRGPNAESRGEKPELLGPYTESRDGKLFVLFDLGLESVVAAATGVPLDVVAATGVVAALLLFGFLLELAVR